MGNGRLDPSVEAALDFALNKLSIRSVVVCGHSGCGAMTALTAEPAGGSAKEAAAGRSSVDTWLDHARPSLAAFRSGHPVQAAAAGEGYGEVDQLAMVNVAVQLERLQRHPGVREALRSRGLHLTGLFYDIATAQVLQVTPEGISHLDPLPRAAVEAGPVAASV